MSLLNDELYISNQYNVIVSPCFGFIERLDVSDGYYKLYIYITRKSNHKIFMSIDGTLSTPTFEGGKLDKNGHFKQIIPDPLHPHDPNLSHTATLTWRIYNDKKTSNPIVLKIHVGKPEYITDEIAMKNYPYQQIDLKGGIEIGEIIIGSRAELYLPTNMFVLANSIQIRSNLTIDDMEHIRDDLIGGQTILAYKKHQSY